MLPNADFSAMLSALSAEGADYLLVGAHALAAHGVPRATGDLDLWVRATGENAARVWRALAAFGAPLSGLSPEDLARPGLVVQIGVSPVRIDLLTSLDGVVFEEAWKDRKEIRVDGLPVPVIGRRHLILNKRATGRPQDLADVARLEAIGEPES